MRPFEFSQVVCIRATKATHFPGFHDVLQWWYPITKLSMLSVRRSLNGLKQYECPPRSGCTPRPYAFIQWQYESISGLPNASAIRRCKQGSLDAFVVDLDVHDIKLAPARVAWKQELAIEARTQWCCVREAPRDALVDTKNGFQNLRMPLLNPCNRNNNR